QTVTTAEDTDKTITLTGDDGDPEVTQSLTFTITTLPVKGALYQTADGVTRGAAITATGTAVTDSLGRLIFAPDTNENGTGYASFQFTVTDDASAGGPALTSAAATVTINVAPVNDTPTADGQTVITAED